MAAPTLCCSHPHSHPALLTNPVVVPVPSRASRTQEIIQGGFHFRRVGWVSEWEAFFLHNLYLKTAYSGIHGSDQHKTSGVGEGDG
jgi:hypothetical protein